MKSRTIRNQQQAIEAGEAIKDIANFPYVITISRGDGIRNHDQNAAYWCAITDALEHINNMISEAADDCTNLEMRRVVARSLEWEHSLILGARKPEVVHEIMKMICGVPTSTRLGTSEFAKFRQIMENTLDDIVGEIEEVIGAQLSSPDW